MHYSAHLMVANLICSPPNIGLCEAYLEIAEEPCVIM